MSAPTANARSLPVTTAPANPGVCANRVISRASVFITALSRRGYPSSLSSVRRSTSSRAVATRRVLTAASGSVRSGCQALANKINDGLRRGAWQENLRDPALFQRGNVGLRNDPADEHGDVVHPFSA